MNKTIAITAITMFAVMMGLSAFAPAMADKPVPEPKAGKTILCHVPPGNPSNAHVIQVSDIDALNHQLEHDDDFVIPDDGSVEDCLNFGEPEL